MKNYVFVFFVTTSLFRKKKKGEVAHFITYSLRLLGLPPGHILNIAVASKQE